MESRGDVTRLLADLGAGKKGADNELMTLVYGELHALAMHYMRKERPGHTLQTTALVHEAYLRLGGEKDLPWESKAHFLRVAARAMRRILIDHARRKQTERRGGEKCRKALEESAVFGDSPPPDLIAIDNALKKISEVDPQVSQVVEMRFFGGLTVEETARVLRISARTVKREWRVAKAWLKKQVCRK